MQFDLTVYLFAWVLLSLLALLFCRFWPGGNPPPAVPTPPRRKREPKPFAGYTRKPECQWCEQPVQSPPQAPGAPPPRMTFTRGRRRQVETTGHFCPYRSGKVLAYVFGRRQDEAFLKLKTLLEPFGITRYYTDYWGAYTRHIDADEHQPGKRNTQKIERKHLTLRARIKRLARKTICFSKSVQMHDIVIGLFVNRYEFGVPL